MWGCSFRIENEKQVVMSLSGRRLLPAPHCQLHSFQGDDDPLGTEVIFSEFNLDHRFLGRTWSGSQEEMELGKSSRK